MANIVPANFYYLAWYFALIFSFYYIKPQVAIHWYQIEPYDPLTQWEETPVIKDQARESIKEEVSPLPQISNKVIALKNLKFLLKL